MIIKLTGTGSGKADLRCDGWKGSRHIQFAIQDREEKYLKSRKIVEDPKNKQADGAKKPDKYEIVFAGGKYWNQVSGDDSSQIELDGTTLLLHLKSSIVQAIYYNLSNGLFLEIEDLEPGGPKASGGIREDKNFPVTTTSGNGRIESSAGVEQFLGDDPEPDPAPEQNGAAAEGAAGAENASQTGDAAEGAGGAGAAEGADAAGTAGDTAGKPSSEGDESQSGSATETGAAGTEAADAAGADDSAGADGTKTDADGAGAPDGSAGGSPVEQPAGKHFPWKTVILILVTLLVIAALAVGGWFLWKKFGSMLTGLFPQPVPAKVEDPCSVESATDELKFISKCAGESVSDESLRKIIADGKAHNKCSIAKKIYLSKIYSDGTWSLEYAKEFDPAAGGSSCFPADAKDAVYWYRQAEDLGVKLDDATAKHVSELEAQGSGK